MSFAVEVESKANLSGACASTMQYHNVAVFLAAYNGLNWLEQQIQSILDQKNVFVTIYVNIDSSVDGTESYIKQLALIEPRIKVLPLGVRFGSAASNFFYLIKSVDFSSFEYVSFSDQDDVWFADKLVRAITALNKQEANIYSSNVTAFWDDGREILIDKAQPQKTWDHYFEAAGPGCTYMMQASVAYQLKIVITQQSEELKDIALHDWFIYAWARHNGLRWFIDPVPSMRYRQHAANVVGVNNGLAAAKSRFNKLSGGWYSRQIMLIATAINAVDVQPIQWIKNPSLYNKFKLLFSVSNCRRRLRDRLGFIVFILMLRKHEK
jgi:rhamnosyltransferase